MKTETLKVSIIKIVVVFVIHRKQVLREVTVIGKFL